MATTSQANKLTLSSKLSTSLTTKLRVSAADVNRLIEEALKELGLRVSLGSGRMLWDISFFIPIVFILWTAYLNIPCSLIALDYCN